MQENTNNCKTFIITYTAWKVSKCEFFSGPYFPAFGLNTKRHGVSPYSVQMRENTEQKNSVFRHFLRSDTKRLMIIKVYLITYWYFCSLFGKFIELPTKEFVSKAVKVLQVYFYWSYYKHTCTKDLRWCFFYELNNLYWYSFVYNSVT